MDTAIEYEVSTRSISRLNDMLEEMRELAAEVKQARHDSRQMLTVAQVAERMQVGTSTVYRWIQRMDNPLPALNEGGVIRVHPGRLENWMNDQSEGQPPSVTE